MKIRGVAVMAALSCLVVAGGWFMQRGLRGTAVHVRRPVDGGRLYDEVFSRVSTSYVEPLPVDSLYRKTVDGLLHELNDPHSVYLSADRLTRLNESTSGRYEGIGVQVDVRDGWITVIAPLPGGPSEEAGIQTGDRIVEIEGKDTFRWTTEEARNAMRGPPGTLVRVGVERPGMSSRLAFRLARRPIAVRSVRHALLVRDGVGYVDFTVFSKDAVADLQRAVDSVRGLGARSLILDLRGDPGGLLDQGVAVSELFLDPGARIVEMRGRLEEMRRTFSDREPQRWPDMPLAVLVDSSSASASEIVAGALQDNDRAVVVGVPTFGKGSAQSVFPLDGGGALKLTVARWFTPLGRSIERVPDSTRAGDAKELVTPRGRKVRGGGGISPDVQIADTSLSRSLIALQAAVGSRAGDLRDVLTAYGLEARASRSLASPAFVVTDAMRAEVVRRLAARKVQLDSVALSKSRRAFDRLLAGHLARYAFGADAEFTRNLRDDPVVNRAAELLAGAADQKAVFARVR